MPLAPEVAAAIAAGKSGSLVATVDGHRYRYAFHPLSSLDWAWPVDKNPGWRQQEPGRGITKAQKQRIFGQKMQNLMYQKGLQKEEQEDETMKQIFNDNSLTDSLTAGSGP